MKAASLVEIPAILREPQPRRPGRFVVGVDGGATKTEAAVLDLAMGGIWLGHGGPSNPDAVGPGAAASSLVEAADSALDAAGASREQVAAAVLAIAGTDSVAVSQLMPTTAGAPWVVVNDVVGAWAAATSAGPGIAVISGTGSNVFGVGADGGGWRAGGWGHVLGDEGSGYWLGLESIKAALHERDGSGPKTMLTDAVLRFFAVADVETLASMVYSKPLSKGAVAACAVETCRAAIAGDPVACALYRTAAEDLARQVVAVVCHTDLRGNFLVGLIGSAFKAGPVFTDPLETAILATLRSASAQGELSPPRVVRVQIRPVGGCLLLACRAAGRGGSGRLDAISRFLTLAGS